jgi:hypothetical protein
MNEAKEIAKNLIEKVSQTQYKDFGSIQQAKQVSIIFVNEILNSEFIILNEHLINFWEQVKIEIKQYENIFSRS